MGCTVSAEIAASAAASPSVDVATVVELDLAERQTERQTELVRSLHRLGEDVGGSLSIVKGDVSLLRMDLREDCAELNQALRELRASLEILQYRACNS